tara:strand:- start:1851 stop:2315 length:465 start_codon:yes stop_codon:yes gene_type:complete
MKDPNRIARIEKAIAKKYGPEAIANPRGYWNDEKEKSYQDQIEKVAQKERAFDESEEKEEVNGILISKKLLTREAVRRDCPVCETFSFNLKDDAYMNKYSCCYKCYVQWVDGREERWETGWRPSDGPYIRPNLLERIYQLLKSALRRIFKWQPR